MGKRLSLLALALAVSVMAIAMGHDKGASLKPSVVAAVCVSGNMEEQDIILLEQGAEIFGLPSLAEVAKLMKNHALDYGNRHAISATAALADYAARQYGIVSREAVVCRRAYLQAVAGTEKTLALQIARENASQAEQLYQDSPKDKGLKVLSLVTRMERIFMENQHDMDNATHWSEVFEIEKTTEELIKKKGYRCQELVDLCVYLSVWKSNKPSSDIVCYVDYVFHQTFPEGVFLQGLLENGYVNNAEGWAQRAFNDARALWGERDVRTIRCELQLITSQLTLPTTDYDQQHGRLQEMQEWLEQYLPNGDLFPVEVELLKWDYDIASGKNVYEASRTYPLLMKVERFYGDKKISYLNYLHRILNQQLQVNIEKAADLLREEERLLDNLDPHHSDLYWAYQLGTVYIRFAMSEKDPEAFQGFLTKLNDYYISSHKPSWQSVYVGRNLTEIYRSMQRADDVVDTYAIVLGDIAELVPQSSPLWSFFQSAFVGYLSESSNPTNLQKANLAVDEVIRSISALGWSVADLHYLKATIAFALDKEEDGIDLLRKGISACTSSQDGFYRCLMQMELGNRLFYQKAGYVVTPEIQSLFDESIPFFLKNREQAGGAYMNCYLYLADYYTNTGQYDKAEEAYLMGLQHLETISEQFYNTYSDLATGLFSLYAYQLNDLNKADEVIGMCIKSAEKNYNFNAHIFITNLLFSRYELLVSKNVDIPLQFAALNDCLLQLQMAKSINEGDQETLLGMYLKLLYSIGNYMKEFSDAISECEKVTHSDDENMRTMAMKGLEMMMSFRRMLDSDFLEIVLGEVEEQEKGGHVSDDSRLANAYRYLGDYYLYLRNDTTQAEKYYSLLYNTRFGHTSGLGALAVIKESRGQYAEAAKLLEDMMSQSEYETYSSIQTKASDAYRIFNCYYHCGQYEQALKQARRFADYRRQIATINFDLLTETERESFVKQGGTGGMPLYTLLPKFSQELSAEALNAILTEKSLLLRSSERIKQAISQLADSTIITQLDTLRQLRNFYKTLDVSAYIYADAKSNEMVKCRQQIEELERSINRKASQQIEGMNAPSWQELQQVLKPNEAIVEYVFSDTIIGSLLLLPHGTPLYIPLTSSNSLWQALDEMKDFEARQRVEMLYQDDRLHLYNRLWKPIESALKEAEVVYFSPTGFLNELAFSAFKCEDGLYLSDRYELHQMLSTGDLVDLRRHSVKSFPKTAMLYGAVSYSQDQNGMQRNGDTNQRGAIVDEDYFGFLPFTLEEVEKVRDLMNRKHVDVRLLTGLASTEQALHDISGHSPDVLHLSTHGFFVVDDKVDSNNYLARFPSMRFSSMQRSGLALALANETWSGVADKAENADGIVSASEVSQLDLSNTQLTVLSACQTAVGHYSLEGVYGMHRGFKQAGVKSILASLWNVNDESTAQLMTLFYDKWLSGMPMQQSLREAVKELRRDYPSPYFWAPFVLMDGIN